MTMIHSLFENHTKHNQNFISFPIPTILSQDQRYHLLAFALFPHPASPAQKAFPQSSMPNRKTAVLLVPVPYSAAMSLYWDSY